MSLDPYGQYFPARVRLLFVPLSKINNNNKKKNRISLRQLGGYQDLLSSDIVITMHYYKNDIKNANGILN